jgi:small-conductance mechanosensitive channel
MRMGNIQRKQAVIAGLWLALIAAAVLGLVLTRPSAPPPSRFRAPRGTWARLRNLVDQKPLETARALAAQAWTREEHPLARRALNVADDAVDLAFATALRDAAAHPAPPTEEIRKITAHLKETETSVVADQEAIEALQGLKSKNEPEVQQEIALAQAQLALDQDDVANARQDLMRAGGDLQGALKRMLDAHLATHAAVNLPNTPPFQESWALASHLRTWQWLRGKLQQLASASQQALDAAAALNKAHDELAARVEQQKSGETGSVRDAVRAVRRTSEDTKSLADYVKRIQDQQDLSEIYRDWGAVVTIQQRASVHGMILDLLWILLICVAAWVALVAIGRFGASLDAERKRLRSLQFAVRLVVQMAAVAATLIVLLGSPGQLTTVIGLAGAGLTVALKDFIVAFFGWFVLMGNNGIRVGDWVEINGIGGEVVEIGLLRTVLLETGQWSDAGHPTGRKVAFVNSFAVEGHYFNFSTSGQWLWDEIQVVVPSGEDPYRVLKAVQDLVAAEAQENVRQAEQEWQKVARGHALQSFSAAPAINVKPTDTGVNITVRYITRAHERFEMRSRLYRAIVELLHTRGAGNTVKTDASDAGKAADGAS